MGLKVWGTLSGDQTKWTKWPSLFLGLGHASEGTPARTGGADGSPLPQLGSILYIYIYCKPTYTGGAFVPFFLNKEGLLEDHHVWHTF